MPDVIYIYHNNRQEGPYSSDQLHDMIAKGVVTPVTLAWKEGMSGWAALNTIVACAERPSRTGPPPPPAAYAAPPPIKASPLGDVPGPKGVGGWLLFFCVGLTILSPLFSLSQILVDWEEAQPAFAQFPSLKTAAMWEMVGSIALISYGFIVGCMIWGGNPNGREIAKKFLLIRLFGFIGIEFIAVVIMGDMPTEVVASLISFAVGEVFVHLIWFLIWWFYFKKSKRVRNTYGAN